MASSFKRYYSLDIVRAIAACSVAFGHMQMYLPAPSSTRFERALFFCDRALNMLLVGTGKTSAHPGVIVFVVLSGFCIHLPLARDPTLLNDKLFWRIYCARRFGRIAPVYWWGCALGVASVVVVQRYAGVIPIWLGPDALNAVSIVRKVVFLDPILPDSAVGLGNPAIRSVATELWLYALYPVALRWVLTQIGSVTCRRIVLVYLFSAVFVVMPPGPAWGYESVPRFFVWWLIGAAAATEAQQSFAVQSIRKYVYAFVLTFCALVGFNQTPYFRGSYLISVPLLAIATGTGIVLMMTLEHRRSSRPGLVSRCVAYIGERSYSLYVVHMPLLGFLYAAKRWPPVGYWHAQIGSPICVAAFAVTTWITYEAIEKPCHEWSRRQRTLRPASEGSR